MISKTQTPQKRVAAILSFLIVLLLSNDMVIGQQIRIRPCEWDKRYESGPVKSGKNCESDGDWWKVVSIRPNNTLYENAALSSPMQISLKFKENVYVIDETNTAIKVVQVGHYDGNMNLKADAAQFSGWISKDNLLLHNSCLVVQDLSMPGYSGTVINKKGVILRNVDASGNQVSLIPQIFSEPELDIVVSEPKEFRYAFVYMRRGNRYLVGEEPILTNQSSTSTSNSLWGWISASFFVEWNTNLALETNWDRTNANTDILLAYEDCNEANNNLIENNTQFNTYRLPDPKNGKRLVGETPRLIWLGHPTKGDENIEHVGYVGDLCYLDKAKNKKICLSSEEVSIIEHEFTNIKKKQRQVKLLFVIDGTQSIQKFSEEIKQTIDKAMGVIRSKFATDDSYTFSYGCVMYWDTLFKKRTMRIGWVSDETKVSSFIQHNLDNPPGNPNDDHEELMMEGLDLALSSFSFEALESNFIMLIGDAGARKNEYDELRERIIQKLSKSYFNILAIQFSHNNNPKYIGAYNAYRSQVKDLIIESVRRRYSNYSIPDLTTRTTDYGKETHLSTRWGTCWLKEPNDGEAFDSKLVTHLIQEGITTIFSQGLTTELNLIGKKLEQEIGNNYPPGSINMLWDLFNRNYSRGNFDLSQVKQVIKLAYTPTTAPNSQIKKLRDVCMFDYSNLDLLSQYFNNLTETVINNPVDLRQSIIQAWWEILLQSGGWNNTEDGEINPLVLQLTLGQLSEIITGLPGKEAFRNIKLGDINNEKIFSNAMLYEYIIDWVIAKAGLNSVLQGKQLITQNYIYDHYWPFFEPYIAFALPNEIAPADDEDISAFCSNIAKGLNNSINTESIDFYVPKIDIGGTQHYWLDARIFPHNLFINGMAFNKFIESLL